MRLVAGTIGEARQAGIIGEARQAETIGDTNLTKAIAKKTMNNISMEDNNALKESGDISMENNDVLEQTCPHCSGKHKMRDEKERKDLINRLKRIEGQVRGVEGMLEKDAYCPDILIQVQAITSALNSFNKVLLANHVKSCVADNIRSGNDEVVDELVETLQKLMK